MESPYCSCELTRPPVCRHQADPCATTHVEASGEHVLAAAGEVHLQMCVKDLRERFAKVQFRGEEPRPTAATPVDPCCSCRLIRVRSCGQSRRRSCRFGESWPTAAIPMENPCCSCTLTSGDSGRRSPRPACRTRRCRGSPRPRRARPSRSPSERPRCPRVSHDLLVQASLPIEIPTAAVSERRGDGAALVAFLERHVDTIRLLQVIAVAYSRNPPMQNPCRSCRLTRARPRHRRSTSRSAARSGSTRTRVRRG